MVPILCHKDVILSLSSFGLLTFYKQSSVQRFLSCCLLLIHQHYDTIMTCATRSRFIKLSHSPNEMRPSMLLDEPGVLNKERIRQWNKAHKAAGYKT